MTVWRKCAFPVVNGALGRPSTVPPWIPAGPCHRDHSPPARRGRRRARPSGTCCALWAVSYSASRDRGANQQLAPRASTAGWRGPVASPTSAGRTTGESGEWRQRAEERTHTTTLRTLGPMAFLISSGMYVSILGPASPPVVGMFGGYCQFKMCPLSLSPRYATEAQMAPAMRLRLTPSEVSCD